MRCRGISKGQRRCECKCRCHKDSQAYDFVETLGNIPLPYMTLEVIDMVGILYVVKAGPGGKRGYDPRVMTVIIIMKTFTKKTSHSIVGELKNNPTLLDILNLRWHTAQEYHM